MPWDINAEYIFPFLTRNDIVTLRTYSTKIANKVKKIPLKTRTKYGGYHVYQFKLMDGANDLGTVKEVIKKLPVLFFKKGGDFCQP